ncbi:MAG: hypothetical protein RXN91_07335 [Caldivirga sp.]|jgi:uncharacterized protein YkwD
MAYHVWLIDCLHKCEDYNRAGSPARAGCYRDCIDQFGRIIDAMVQGRLMSINDYETMVRFKDYCARLVGNVDDLSRYCEEYYRNMTTKPTKLASTVGEAKSEAKGEVAEGQFTDELADCMRDCVRYYGDNAPELNRCYSMCRAIWGNTGVKWSCGEFKSCFPEGCFELEEFKREFRRIGKSGFEDWQIVSRVGSIIGTMLREGGERGCRDLEDNITKLMITELEDLGIDRYSIRKAYLHGLSSEVKDILMKIFPNVIQISKDRESEETPGPILIPEPTPEPETPTPKYYTEPVKLQTHRSRGKIIGIIVMMVFTMLVAFAIIHTLKLNNVTPQAHSTNTTSTISEMQSQVQGSGSEQGGIDSSWVSQFISIVNQYRVSSKNETSKGLIQLPPLPILSSRNASPLQYCPWLSNFAYIRFEAMSQNPSISHYGFNEDFYEYLDQYQGFLSVGEEVLFPSGYTPSGFVQYMISNAPLHWGGLMDGDFAYYGYYIGYAPTYVIEGYCPVTEIPGPNINIPQYFQSQGCSVKLENMTWLVLELSNWCSGPITFTVSSTNSSLLSLPLLMGPNEYIYLPIQYNLATITNGTYVELNINVQASSQVKLFIFTPDQFNYFKNLNAQQAVNFTGPAYYYGGNSTSFNTTVMLNTAQLANDGYYLVISNILSGQFTSVTMNITITFKPTTPNIPTPPTSH